MDICVLSVWMDKASFLVNLLPSQELGARLNETWHFSFPIIISLYS